MKRSLLLGIPAATLLAGHITAQPALEHLGDLDMAAAAAFITSIAYVNGSAYLVSVDNRRVIKIADVLTKAPVTSLLFQTDQAEGGPLEWIPGSGLLTVDVLAGAAPSGADLVLATGDGYGNNGRIVLIDGDEGTLFAVANSNIGGTGRRYGGAAFWGDASILAIPGNGADFLQLTADYVDIQSDDPGRAFVGSAFIGDNPGAPPDSASRKTVVDPAGVAYTSWNNAFIATPVVIGVARLEADFGSPIDEAEATRTPEWFSIQPVEGASSVQGIGLMEYEGTTWVILCNHADGDLIFIDTADADNNFTVSGDDLDGLDNPADIAVAGLNGNQYLLVAQYEYGDRVSIFGVDGAQLLPETRASGWELYR